MNGLDSDGKLVMNLLPISGGLAQLGERQAGSLKVTGSIPVSSTSYTVVQSL